MFLTMFFWKSESPGLQSLAVSIVSVASPLTVVSTNNRQCNNRQWVVVVSGADTLTVVSTNNRQRNTRQWVVVVSGADPLTIVSANNTPALTTLRAVSVTIVSGEPIVSIRGQPVVSAPQLLVYAIAVPCQRELLVRQVAVSVKT